MKKQQAQGISAGGVYRYTHRRVGGADVHHVFVEKSSSRLLFSYLGAMLLLANVCYALLKQESLCLSSFWCVPFSAIVAKCLHYKPVKKESLMIMPGFGVQLEQHFWSGRVHRQFVPIGKILKPMLNECVTPVTCYWSLTLLLRDEDDITLVFKELHPPVKMLVPIWKALCAFTSSNSIISPSEVPRPTSSHQLVEQDGDSPWKLDGAC